MNYKDLKNNLHVLDSVEFEHLLPAGSVQITDEEAAAIQASQVPVIAPQVAIDAKLAQLRAVREEILNRLGGIAGRADRKGDKATADACDAATQSLLDITKDLPADIEAIELEVVTRYKAIGTTAAITAPGLASAFVGVDL